jgi:DNA invertase Pin-like site-specific DNA recombinase
MHKHIYFKKELFLANYAYLRVSRDTQDTDNQKFGILEYCNKKAILPISIFEDTESRLKSWKERSVGKILLDAKKDDVIVASEFTRLAGSPLQVLEILEESIKKGVHVHIVKEGIILDDSLQSTIYATVFGLAAFIEKSFISSRTKEALKKRRSEGVQLGRPRGKAKSVKLDKYSEIIIEYLAKGVSKRAISKIIECSSSTLYSWIKRNQLKIKRKK